MPSAGEAEKGTRTTGGILSPVLVVFSGGSAGEDPKAFARS
jgi:hypothetical protein